MLTRQRYEKILELLERKKSITVTEVKELLDTSESTARRDLTALHKAGKLTKVFGGAVCAEQSFAPYELTVDQKKKLNVAEKKIIAQYAAALVAPNDFVFIDAGTTTGYMIDYITETTATYVTNAVTHAQTLAARGFRVILLGGEVKKATEAIVGNQALDLLQSYHFTKGFFGVNGITRNNGCTTPDLNEAVIKKTAIQKSKEKYVLADASKFGKISSVTFAAFDDVDFITEKIADGYKAGENVILAGRQ